MCKTEVFDALKYRIVVDCHGNRLYYNTAGQLHRTDGPAIECANGNKFWYQNGHLHRTDGAAVEYSNGDKEWYQDDLRHRVDGPAVEYCRGSGNGGLTVWNFLSLNSSRR